MRHPLLLLALTIVFSGCTLNRPNTVTGLININGSDIYYTIAGDGEPLLLAHAGFQDHAMWDSQVDYLLEANYKVITIDLPGHGKTSADTTLFIKDYIKACLDSLGVKKTSLVGLSLGAVAVTDFALAYPERVNKLVLAGAVVTGYEKKYTLDTFVKQYFIDFYLAVRNNDMATAAEIFTRYWCDGTRTKGEVDTNTRNYVYATTLQTLKRHGWKKGPRMFEPSAISRLHELKMPVLVIYGDKDLPVIIEAAPILEKLLGNARKVEMQNVAHMLNMEAPQQFNTILHDFLKE